MERENLPVGAVLTNRPSEPWNAARRIGYCLGRVRWHKTIVHNIFGVVDLYNSPVFAIKHKGDSVYIYETTCGTIVATSDCSFWRGTDLTDPEMIRRLKEKWEENYAFTLAAQNKHFHASEVQALAENHQNAPMAKKVAQNAGIGIDGAPTAQPRILSDDEKAQAKAIIADLKKRGPKKGLQSRWRISQVSASAACQLAVHGWPGRGVPYPEHFVAWVGDHFIVRSGTHDRVKPFLQANTIDLHSFTGMVAAWNALCQGGGAPRWPSGPLIWQKQIGSILDPASIALVAGLYPILYAAPQNPAIQIHTWPLENCRPPRTERQLVPFINGYFWHKRMGEAIGAVGIPDTTFNIEVGPARRSLVLPRFEHKAFPTLAERRAFIASQQGLGDGAMNAEAATISRWLILALNGMTDPQLDAGRSRIQWWAVMHRFRKLVDLKHFDPTRAPASLMDLQQVADM